MRFLKKIFGMSDPSPMTITAAQMMKKKLLKGNFWPRVIFNREYCKYEVEVNERDIALAACTFDVFRDDEFREILSESIKKAYMQAVIKNQQMKDMLDFCSSEVQKYKD